VVGKFGPNAIDLSLEEFRGLLKGRRGAIKSFLLDQDRMAGIGNVYVQTPLWRARIHPLRPIPSLSEEEITALWQALRGVLQGSIDAGGAPFELNLYGQRGGWSASFLVGYREGQPCPACGTAVVKIRTGSTSSYIRPSCQSL
jgi:formamidopyrimidine-DNA glycosylase